MTCSKLLTATLGSLSVGTGVVSADTSKKTDQPNIVYILADDWGYGDISALNSASKLHTTNTDEIAKAGLIFTNAHSASAVSTPSRYSILTGRYAWRSRLKKGVLNGFSSPLVEKDRETVASMLKEQGYNTACIGKWHLGWDWGKTGKKVDFTKPVTNGPDANGFDYYYSHAGSLDMPPYLYVENGNVTAQPDRETASKGKYGWWRKGQTGADFKHEEVLPNFTKHAVDYISSHANKNKPFFLYLPLPAPHTPILPSKEFQGKSKTNAYGDFVLQVDWSIGQIAKALKESGLEENTLLIITSDYGCSPAAKFNELKKVGHNPSYKFRGYKADIYEGGHRVPFICRWPRVIKPDTTTDQLVCLSDLMATCAEILGVKIKDSAAEDSLSLLPALKGGRIDYSKREAVVHHSINGGFAIQRNGWKLILGSGSCGWSAPRGGKQAIKAGLGPIQLFNLDSDIAEQKNCYKENPERVKSLFLLLESYVEKGRSTPGKKQGNNGKVHYLPKEDPGFKKELNR